MSSNKGTKRASDLLQKRISSGSAVPRLVISKHDAQGEETYTRNGIVHPLHVVVKNTSLQMELKLENNIMNGTVVDFGYFTLDARLVYDKEGPEKEVDYVKNKPIDFKFTTNSTLDSATLDLKIKVLTSQHEDLFFRARVVALDPCTGQEFKPSITCLSEPIKVISKPEQLKKRKPTKKRTLTDLLVETITRIDLQQREQKELIEKLVERTGGAAISSVQPPMSLDAGGEPNSTRELKSDTTDQFENAFANFLLSYNSLPVETRPERIRKLMRMTTQAETEQLSELIDMLSSEGLNQRIGMDITSAGTNTCHCMNCPHRTELLRIDDFYKDFLSGSTAPMPPFDLSNPPFS